MNRINGTETIYDRGYGYDRLDRLTSDGVGEDDPMTYGYDLNDNRQTRKQGAGTDSIDELIDYIEGSNRIEERYTLKRGTAQLPVIPDRTMTYNDVGRLYQLTENGALKTEYIYNDLGQRTKKTIYQSDGITVDSTTIYHYDQWGMLITETNEQGNLIKDYIWNEMHPVAQIDAVIPAQAGIQSTEAITYLYTDHLMTNRLATNQSKAIVWRWEGEAFGNIQAQELAGVSINLRFPGQYYDSETNLHYNHFRYYDPSLGRYITSDPIGLDGGMNTYLYAGANPIINIDPSGLRIYLFQITVGGGVSKFGIAVSVFNLLVVDPIKGETCLYTVACGGVGLSFRGIPDISTVNPHVMWDDGKKCGDCRQFEGQGSAGSAALQAGPIGYTFVNWLQVPNGPRLDFSGYSPAQVNVGGGIFFCDFSL